MYLVEDPDQAARLLDAVIAECHDSAIKELLRLGGTLRRWREPVLNHHRTGRSNGPTEAMNLLIKNVKRVGRGFTQLRELSAPPVAALRRRMGHSPNRINARPPSPLGRVAPDTLGGRPRTRTERQ